MKQKHTTKLKLVSLIALAISFEIIKLYHLQISEGMSFCSLSQEDTYQCIQNFYQICRKTKAMYPVGVSFFYFK